MLPGAMKKTLPSLLCAITSFLLAACGGGNAAAGVYELDTAAFKEALLANMPAEAKKEKATMDLLDGMVASVDVSIELRADGTAVITPEAAAGQPGNAATGTWKLDGSKLTVTTKQKDGKEEAMTADYANGAFTSEVAQGEMKMKMTFKRK